MQPNHLHLQSLTAGSLTEKVERARHGHVCDLNVRYRRNVRRMCKRGCVAYIWASLPLPNLPSTSFGTSRKPVARLLSNPFTKRYVLAHLPTQHVFVSSCMSQTWLVHPDLHPQGSSLHLYLNNLVLVHSQNLLLRKRCLASFYQRSLGNLHVSFKLLPHKEVAHIDICQ